MKNGFETLFKKDFSTFNLQVIKDDIEASKNKDFFKYCGTQLFCGRQGQGKTVSMVYALLSIKQRYPKCKVVTNLILHVDWDYTFVSSMDELGEALVSVNNGIYGVVYAIDEIHSYFNALDSKNIPMYIFTEISQQRKQRKLILGSSQLFLRMAKPFREQCDNLVMCRCLLGFFSILSIYDGATLDEDFGKVKGTLKRTSFFMQTRELRNSYDTYQKVVSGREEYERSKQVVIMGKKEVKQLGKKF